MSFQQKFNLLISKINNNFVWLKNNKQDKLISGNNIKTINGENILGSGNISISGGSTGINAVPITQAEYDALETKDSNTLYILTTRFLVWGSAAWSRGVWGLQDEQQSD